MVVARPKSAAVETAVDDSDCSAGRAYGPSDGIAMGFEVERVRGWLLGEPT